MREIAESYRNQCQWIHMLRVSRDDWKYHACGLVAGHDGPHSSAFLPRDLVLGPEGTPGVWMLLAEDPVVQK